MNTSLHTTKIKQCIKSRLEWPDLELMRDIIVVLNTQGREKLLEESNPLHEVLRLVARLKVPLQGAEVGGYSMLQLNLIYEVLYFLFNYF